jgi:hypothetical protein
MREEALAEQKSLANQYQTDTSADFSSLLKALTPTAAVPEGPSSFTPNVSERDVVENPRMVMRPETDYEGGIIEAGQPGAGNFGVTPGTPAIPAKGGRLSPEGFGAMKTPAGQQQYMAQLLAQNKPREPKWELKEIKTADGGVKTMLLDMNAPNPMSTATEQGTQKPTKKPIVVGNVLLDPDTYQPVYTGPKAARTGDLGNYDEYVAQQTKAGKKPVDFDQFLLNQKIAARQPANVTYGSPVAAVDASGKPVFIQPGRAGGAPSVMQGFTPPEAKLKDVPPNVNAAIIANQAAGNQLDRAIALMSGEDLPGMTGDKSATALKGYLPNAILSRIDPQGVSARAEIADIGSLKINDRSGAAVTASETPRLMPFIPLATDDNETVLKKLRRLKLEVANETNAMKEIYSKEQGFKENPVLNKPSVAGKTTTLQEIQDVATKTGKTVEQVTKDALAKGYKVQ